jgi:hypothetical protein
LTRTANDVLLAVGLPKTGRVHQKHLSRMKGISDMDVIVQKTKTERMDELIELMEVAEERVWLIALGRELRGEIEADKYRESMAAYNAAGEEY